MASIATTRSHVSLQPAMNRAFAPVLIGFLGVAALLVAMYAEPRLQHWFVLPVLGCGFLAGADALLWFRSDDDTFNAYAIFGLIGIHLFCIAPLLHVMSDYWMPYIDPPNDWKHWLGMMACLNLVGLGMYRVSRDYLDSRLPAARLSTTWELNVRRFAWLASIAIICGTFLQFAVYAKFGGIGGYMQAFTESPDQFTGLGFVFMFSESVPIVAVLAAIYWARESGRRRTFAIVVAILLGFIALKLFFGGLRGSRGHFVYGLFWVAAIIHVLYRPLPKKFFLIGACSLIVFMYAYSFYKNFGADALQMIESADTRAELQEARPHAVAAVLLGDLARSDVQAFMLYRLSPECAVARYKYVLGQTYLGTVSLLIPRSFIGERPPTKVKAGTDLLFGPGVYERELVSTFAFGLTGEAMLNFGVVGGLLSFVVFAAMVVFARRQQLALSKEDSRNCVFPLLLSVTFLALLWDTDVLLFYSIKEGFVPVLLIVLASTSVKKSVAVEEGSGQ